MDEHTQARLAGHRAIQVAAIQAAAIRAAEAEVMGELNSTMRSS